MNRELRDFLCELLGVLWTISACGEKGIDQAACDYAERLMKMLNKTEDGNGKCND